MSWVGAWSVLRRAAHRGGRAGVQRGVARRRRHPHDAGLRRPHRRRRRLPADGTAEAVRAVDDARVTVIRHERNQGVGGAILIGTRQAIELGPTSRVVMAGDAQMDPAYLPALLDPIVDDGYDFTKGNRFFSRNSWQGMPRHRDLRQRGADVPDEGRHGLLGHLRSAERLHRDHAGGAQRLPLERVAHALQFENDVLIWLNILDVRARTCPSRPSTATRCPASGCTG